MKGQRRLFNPANVSAHQFAPVADVAAGAASYAESQGLKYTPPSNQQQVDHQRGFAQAQAYKRAQAAPSEAPGIRDSYASMREHVNKQYEHLTTPKEKGGMGFVHEVTDSDPYDSPASMAADVRSGRIRTFATASTGGHEYFSNEENDKFRAVHDVFGHAGVGRGFSRHGEEAAYRAHKSMFPKEAHAALTSETRGQNSYLNYEGSNSFPDQGPGSKLVGLPKWAEGEGKLPRGRSKKKLRPQSTQGTLF